MVILKIIEQMFEKYWLKPLTRTFVCIIFISEIKKEKPFARCCNTMRVNDFSNNKNIAIAIQDYYYIFMRRNQVFSIKNLSYSAIKSINKKAI